MSISNWYTRCIRKNTGYALNGVKYVALDAINYRTIYVDVAVDFRNQNAVYFVCELSIEWPYIQIQMHSMVREKKTTCYTGRTKLCLATVEEVEKKFGHNALENDNGKATNKKNNNNSNGNDDDDDVNDGDDDTSNNNKQANILDNGKYEENQLDVRLFCWQR